jgi:hypothetical protein
MNPDIKKMLFGVATIVVGVALAEIVKAMFVDKVVAKIKEGQTDGYEVI